MIIGKCSNQPPLCANMLKSKERLATNIRVSSDITMAASLLKFPIRCKVFIVSLFHYISVTKLKQKTIFDFWRASISSNDWESSVGISCTSFLCCFYVDFVSIIIAGAVSCGIWKTSFEIVLIIVMLHLEMFQECNIQPMLHLEVFQTCNI
jgi:hypothetical protein